MAQDYHPPNEGPTSGFSRTGRGRAATSVRLALLLLISFLSTGSAFSIYDPFLDREHEVSLSFLEEINQQLSQLTGASSSTAEKKLPPRPLVQAPVDTLCPPPRIKDQICLATYMHLTFTEDTVIEVDSSLKGIIFSDTQLYCKSRKNKNEGCSITLKLRPSIDNETLIQFHDHSILAGQRIFIDSPTSRLVMDETSSISTSGRSRSSKGSGGDQGGSFIGKGGTCGENPQDKTYGQFDMLPNPTNIYDMKDNTLIGSVGENSPLDTSTQGGGHIQIKVDSISFKDSGIPLEANGLPIEAKSDPDNLNGGSGGYIYIKTENKYDNNTFQQSTVQALGGTGKNKGYGGAGGVIVLDGDFERDSVLLNFQVNGGTAGPGYDSAKPVGCGTGASGTVYHLQSDLLLLDNKGETTTQSTVSKLVQNRNPTDYNGENLVAEQLILRGGARLEMSILNQKEALVPFAEMTGTSALVLNALGRVNMFNLKYMYKFEMEPESTLDFQSVYALATIERKEPTKEGVFIGYTREWWVDKDDLRLGQCLFSRSLSIFSDDVYIQSDLRDPAASETDAMYGRIRIYGERVHVEKDVELAAAKVFIYANQSILMRTGSKINSMLKNECAKSVDEGVGYYKCFNTDVNTENITYQGMLDYYNEQFGVAGQVDNIKYAKSSHQLDFFIFQKWRIYLMSLGSIDLEGSRITGPRIGLCSNELYIEDSRVDVSARGCPADSGLGVSEIASECGGAGGAHGGAGGHGGSETGNEQSIEKCRTTFPKPYYFGKEAALEGSGGTSGDFQKSTGGSGGGVVWLSTPQTTTIKNSSIRADGNWGRQDDQEQFGSGGGAGGSVQITTLNLRGDGFISARGGHGSPNGGGGGAGGRFVLNYLKGYLSTSQPDQSFYWTGSYSGEGGMAGPMIFDYLKSQSGGEGTRFHSKCFPGYSGVFCKACEVGEYKYDYSYGACLPCLNKPQFAFYTTSAMDSSICDYQCDPLFEGSEKNPDCLDPISLSVQRLGGVIPFFGLLLIFLVISLFIFMALSYRSEAMRNKLKSYPETLYQIWEDKDESGRGKITENDLTLRDSNVWSHTHRMYLIGFNSIRYPWFIPKDFPRDALKKPDRDKFLKFIDDINPKLRYSTIEKWAFVFFNIFYPPLSKTFHFWLRKKKFEALQRAIYLHFPPQFWTDKGDNKSIRLGCSKCDYQLAYFDFIDYDKKRENWLGLKVPMPILLAGAGTFNHPYKLDYERDIYAKSLVLIKFDFFQDKLPIFLENFNTQLAKLSFLKLETQVMRDLSKTVRWLESANLAMFNHFNIKCILYLVENQYTEVEVGVLKQKRRSFPLESIFFDAFPEMYVTLLRYVKAKIMSHKSEIRLALVFKRFDKKKFVKTEQRISKMTKTAIDISAYKVAIAREESVLFDDADNDKEDEKITFANRPANALGSQASLVTDSSASLTSAIQLHLDPTNKIKPVKLVDKAKRAFSLSIESSKAFELAIRKPRRKLKHKITTIRAKIYSIYLLLMKHHGTPPASKDLSLIFAAYSAIVSLDLLLLLNYTFHLIIPMQNFWEFGWIFSFVFFGVPYIAPVLALFSALMGSESLMKHVGNLNAIAICFNIPLVLGLSLWKEDDPIYAVTLFAMIFVKVVMSMLSAKVRMFMINPRYSSNKEKLKKILSRQMHKKKLFEEALGKDTMAKLEESQTASDTTLDSLDAERLRDKLLE